MKNTILELFHRLALPAKDLEGGAKVDMLLDILKENELNCEYTKGVGILVNKLESPKTILVSHFDLISKFRKKFTKEKYELTINEEENIVKGALDNTITNATILAILDQINLDQVEILFTEGEEVGFDGIKEYLKEHKDRVKKCFFINLDVTNEGYGKDASFEYDKPNFSVLKESQQLFKDNNFKIAYTGDRVCDDLDVVVDRDMHGVSFCLPTKGLIHSFKNKAKLSSLEPYAYSLIKLIEKSLSFYDKEKDFSPYIMKKALSTDDKDDLKQKSYSSSWGSSDWGFANLFDDRSNDWEDKIWESTEEENLPPWEIITHEDNVDWDLIHEINKFFKRIEIPETIDPTDTDYIEKVLNYLQNIKEDKFATKDDFCEMFDYNYQFVETVLTGLTEAGILRKTKSVFDNDIYIVS